MIRNFSILFMLSICLSWGEDFFHLETIFYKQHKNIQIPQTITSLVNTPLYSAEYMDDSPRSEILINDSIGFISVGEKLKVVSVKKGRLETIKCNLQVQTYCVDSTDVWFGVLSEQKKDTSYILASYLPDLFLFDTIPFQKYLSYEVKEGFCELIQTKMKNCPLDRGKASFLDSLGYEIIPKVSAKNKVYFTLKEFSIFLGSGNVENSGTLSMKPKVYEVCEDGIHKLNISKIDFHKKTILRIDKRMDVMAVDLGVSPKCSELLFATHQGDKTELPKAMIFVKKEQQGAEGSQSLRIDFNKDGQPELQFFRARFPDAYEPYPMDSVSIGLMYKNNTWYQTSFDGNGGDGRINY